MTAELKNAMDSFKEALSVLMLWAPFSYDTKMADFDRIFSSFFPFLVTKIGLNSEKDILNMARSDGYSDKAARWAP